MKKVVLFLALLTGLLTPKNCMAAEYESYENYQSIPKAFYPYLLNVHTKEALAHYILSELKRINVYHATIDMEHVMKMKKQAIDMSRTQQYSRLRFLDTNSDKQVSQNEIDNFLQGQEKWDEKKKKRALEELRSYDKDSNGILSDKEMKRLDKKRLKELEDEFELVKTLYETNKRKRFISREELNATIKKVFSTLDINHDGTISLNEADKFKKALEKEKIALTTKNKPIKKTCSFNDQKITIPENLAVYAIGADKGKPIDIPLVANRKTYTFDVYINSPEKPVMLMLWAYEGTIWKINVSKGTQLVGVTAGGYYMQVITGVSKNLPVFLTYQAGNMVTISPCHPYRFDSNNESAYNALKSYAEWILEKSVNDFYLVKHDENGILHVGENIDKNTVFSTINDDAISAGRFYSSTTYTPENNLNRGIKEGLIRKATAEEINLWNQQRSAIDIKIYENLIKSLEQSKNKEEQKKKLIKENYGPPLLIIPREAYVVLNSGYSVPLGIEEYFILPLGAKPATGIYGRSQLMDMNSMECYTGSYMPCSKIRLPLDRTSGLPAIIEEN